MHEIEGFEDFKVRHIFREQNCAANHLANSASYHSHDVKILELPLECACRMTKWVAIRVGGSRPLTISFSHFLGSTPR